MSAMTCGPISANQSAAVSRALDAHLLHAGLVDGEGDRGQAQRHPVVDTTDQQDGAEQCIGGGLREAQQHDGLEHPDAPGDMARDPRDQRDCEDAEKGKETGFGIGGQEHIDDGADEHQIDAAEGFQTFTCANHST